MIRVLKTGDKFNKWEVLRFNRTKIYKYTKRISKLDFYLCRCECGKEKEVSITNLLKGKNGSTMCINCSNKNLQTHNMSHTNIYHKWEGIQKRCNNKNYDGYPNYGGRGIKCEWSKFEDFYEDMNDTYTEHAFNYGYKRTTLDRIDVNGNYSKENCRWTNQKRQANNRRDNKYLTYRDKTKTMKEWCNELKLNYLTVAQRLNSKTKRQWTVAEAFETPSLRPRKINQ